MQLGEGLSFPKGAQLQKGKKHCRQRGRGEDFRSQRKRPCELLRAGPVPTPPTCAVLPITSALLTRLLAPWQDFPHISEFPSGSGPRSPGPSNPPSSSGDWESSYPSAECGVSTCRWVPSSTPPPTSRRGGTGRPGMGKGEALWVTVAPQPYLLGAGCPASSREDAEQSETPEGGLGGSDAKAPLGKGAQLQSGCSPPAPVPVCSRGLPCDIQVGFPRGRAQAAGFGCP